MDDLSKKKEQLLAARFALEKDNKNEGKKRVVDELAREVYRLSHAERHATPRENNTMDDQAASDARTLRPGLVAVSDTRTLRPGLVAEILMVADKTDAKDLIRKGNIALDAGDVASATANFNAAMVILKQIDASEKADI
jgi:hypothetical protein